MGGAISVADSNDELIDNLVAAGYLQTARIEQALRCVDRGNYYLANARQNAYRDLAWKEGNLHLSAPCIYAKALECLELQLGMSFLNLGSGTGYLNTVVGFVLGAYGKNFGVEIHEDVVRYAENKLRDFIQNSPSIDTSEFCPPKFMRGNCFQLDLVNNQQSFDRIYCGAAIDIAHMNILRGFLKIRGIMVLPHEDQLLILRRTGENVYERNNILPVSFASMIVPTASELAQHCTMTMPANQPSSLLDICCINTRRVLRRASAEHCGDFRVRSLLLRRACRRSATPTPADVAECDGDDPLRCGVASTNSSRRRRQRRRAFSSRRRGSSDVADSSERESGDSYNVVDLTPSSISIFQFRQRKEDDRRKIGYLISNIIRPLVRRERDEETDSDAAGGSDDDESAECDDLPSTSRQAAVDPEILKGVYLPFEDLADDNSSSDGFVHEAPGFGGQRVENFEHGRISDESKDMALSISVNGSTNKRCRSTSGYALFNEDVGRKRVSVDVRDSDNTTMTSLKGSKSIDSIDDVINNQIDHTSISNDVRDSANVSDCGIIHRKRDVSSKKNTTLCPKNATQRLKYGNGSANSLVSDVDADSKTHADNEASRPHDDVISPLRDDVIALPHDDVISLLYDGVIAPPPDDIVAPPHDDAIVSLADDVIASLHDDVISSPRDDVIFLPQDDIISSSQDGAIASPHDDIAPLHDDVITLPRHDVISSLCDDVIASLDDDVIVDKNSTGNGNTSGAIFNGAVVAYENEWRGEAVASDEVAGGGDDDNGDDGDSDGSDDSIDEEEHRRHMIKSRHRYDVDLKRFVDDFRRRIIALALPETLRSYVNYGRVRSTL